MNDIDKHEMVVCENGHVFDIERPVVDIDIIATIVSCPYVLDTFDGLLCNARIIWRRNTKGKNHMK